MGSDRTQKRRRKRLVGHMKKSKSSTGSVVADFLIWCGIEMAKRQTCNKSKPVIVKGTKIGRRGDKRQAKSNRQPVHFP